MQCSGGSGACWQRDVDARKRGAVGDFLKSGFFFLKRGGDGGAGGVQELADLGLVLFRHVLHACGDEGERAFFAEHSDADFFESALVCGSGNLRKSLGLDGWDLLLHGKAVGHRPKPATGQSQAAVLKHRASRQFFTSDQRAANAISMRFLLPLIFTSSLVLAHDGESELNFDRFFNSGDGWAFHVHTDIESRYASEGRDSLDGDSIATTTFEAAWKALSMGVWYGKSPDQSYDELQLSTALSWEWKDMEWHVAYTHLRFPADGGHDHEIGLGASWPGLPLGLVFAVDAYHSFDAQGTFIETSLHCDFDVGDRLQLSPTIVFGMNQGYVSDGHDGANHIELRLGGEYELTQSLALTAHAAYSFGINRDVADHADDKLLRNFTHAALGLRWEF